MPFRYLPGKSDPNLIFAGSVLVSAAAVAVPANVEKRANTGLYLYNDRGFTGYCVHIPAPSRTCGMSHPRSITPNSDLRVKYPLLPSLTTRFLPPVIIKAHSATSSCKVHQSKKLLARITDS